MTVEYRNLMPGMGQAVAERTVLRKKEDGTHENWGEVATRVALGNSLLGPKEDQEKEFKTLEKHIAKAILLMSGRHLQHGDEHQPTRNMEVFTNCSTAASSFLSKLLLLNGSGVGRSYDDDMIVVNYDHSPNIRCVLDDSHPDFDFSAHESLRDALHKYGPDSDEVKWFEVPDSREGWAKAIELWESATFQKVHKDRMMIFDFSKVRPRGTPIKGMQNRPASGPVPFMNAIIKASTLKGAGMAPWKQAMYFDHYMAECVLVGGARRAARMATKSWRDKSVIEFIGIKRPVEYYELSRDEVIALRAERAAAGLPALSSFLWSSNNSVTVDADFWEYCDLPTADPRYNSALAKHARKVFRLVTEFSYGDGTGEPGLINVDQLSQNGGIEVTTEYVGSLKYQPEVETKILLLKLARRAAAKPHFMITNPCGEIALSLLGGFCVIADFVPFFADSIEEAEDAVRAVTRALIRVNLMDSIYSKEVKRTNRIGVGLTGIHEFAWKFFQVGFRDLIEPDFDTAYVGEKSPRQRAADFWNTLARFSRAVREEAISYCGYLGVDVPHTMITIKPAGTTSKLFGLTEGWHLPAMVQFLRWVQFRSDSEQVQEYRDAGYPVRDLTSYTGTSIVGFPTAPLIGTLGIPDGVIVTAAEATPEEQYKWIQLGERYWLEGNDEEGKKYANQISYTLKYFPDTLPYTEFKAMIKKWQPLVKCCSVMPQINDVAYEYTPEQAVTKAEYEEIVNAISKVQAEDIGREHVDCGTGGCPIDFDEEEEVADVS
jgi:adenosylcobalamin-dependent ribonucleoside-triphosphate reductase